MATPSPTVGHPPQFLPFWAKLQNRTGPAYHPLLCHLIDVAEVARVLWREAVPEATRRWVATGLGLPVEGAEGWVTLIAGLHDLGKLSPPFQLQTSNRTFTPETRAPIARRLEAAGLTWPLHFPNAPHGLIGAYVLRDLLPVVLDVPGTIARELATLTGGHHGVFHHGRAVQKLPSATLGPPAWHEHRRRIVETLAAAFGPYDDRPAAVPAPIALWCAGLVSVADWIASDEGAFPFAVMHPGAPPSLDVMTYQQTARRQAQAAITGLGWTGWSSSHEAKGFGDLFEGKTPNALQAAATKLAGSDYLADPSLVVIEAPMGTGKTEAALVLADHFAARFGRTGLYLALPTQATSNQMLHRLRAFLGHRYPGDRVLLQLLHGQAALSAEFAELSRRGRERRPLPKPANIADDEGGVTGSSWRDGDVVAGDWFTHRKRGLLAPFGVGTVDQALLAVLQARHGFVRLHGLAGKTVVIDEVHAYDTYMTALLERLLAWLAALNCPVILLSATLPAARRRALLAAYAGTRPGQAVAMPSPPPAYPRLSWVGAGRGADEPVGSTPCTEKGAPERRVRVEWRGATDSADNLAALGRDLAAALGGTGCAAVVCNTVGRAQEVYRALATFFPDTLPDGTPTLDLFHARFVYADRERREHSALLGFGRPASTVDMVDEETGRAIRRDVDRPRLAVLVATQVIEQSLDLDFDLLVSDFAPADLLLQRIGRLHRHDRGDQRPPHLREPTVWILGPDEDMDPDGGPRFLRGTTAIYDEHVLLRSWWALGRRDELLIPGDVERLVEDTYPEPATTVAIPPGLPESITARWVRTAEDQAKAKNEDLQQAEQRWIGLPDSDQSLAALTGSPLEEDAPDFHQALQALTRLGEPSVEVVLLYEEDGRFSLDPDGHELVSLAHTPDLDSAKRLLRRSVRIGDRRIAPSLRAETKPPMGWRGSALLRHHRMVALDREHRGTAAGLPIHLDEALGLIVGTPRQEEG